ncbi:MAG: cell division protein FtsA, partial [Pseudomonadota bacterium]
EAERLKRLEGSAFDLSAAAPPIDLARIAPAYAGGALSRAALAAEIRPRLEEMLNLARDRLARGGFGHLPRRRVVLTGGGAMLDGVARLAEDIFAAPVRVGAPILPAGASAVAAGPAFSSLAGLARLVADPPPQLPRSSPAPESRSGVAGLFSWLKDRW